VADVTQRMSAADYLAMQRRGTGAGKAKRRNKYGNHRDTVVGDQKYDSKKEAAHHQALLAARMASNAADRVVMVTRQVPYVLLEKQEGERGVKYIADFVVEFADGRVEVQDTKSEATRKEPTYILKRKMMLKFHGIAIREL